MGSHTHILRLSKDLQTLAHNVHLIESDLDPAPLLEAEVASKTIEPTAPGGPLIHRPVGTKPKSFKDISFKPAASFPIEKWPGSLPLAQIDETVD
jgi:hypothetical protein